MLYEEYFKKFAENDCEEIKQFVPNASAESFLVENAPRLYCPDEVIEETFAFRTWTMRKHIVKTEDGFMLSEFLVNVSLPWAGKHNTINAALTHHLNEFRWLGCADMLLDYIDFFINGDGSYDASQSAFAYHTPALAAIYDFCRVTGNEDYLIRNVGRLEEYFLFFDRRHKTNCGLYWSIDDREGTEYTISGTTPDKKQLRGFRPLFNSCMYADALALASIFELSGEKAQALFYREKAAEIKRQVEGRMWDGSFFKAIHPLDGNLDGDIDCKDIPKGHNARELTGYIPWAYGLASEGKEDAFSLMFDKKVFAADTGLTTAEISHDRFLYFPERACTWCGNVWPYATSYAINAVISLLDNYNQSLIKSEELYELTKKYAEMHFSIEDGKRINFIDEVMLPFEHIWYARELARRHNYNLTGGINRGRDYNHSTFIDLVIRGLLGIDTSGGELSLKPRITGIWKWFKIENLTYRKRKYNVYYDEDGTVFCRGKGIIIERA